MVNATVSEATTIMVDGEEKSMGDPVVVSDEFYSTWSKFLDFVEDVPEPSEDKTSDD